MFYIITIVFGVLLILILLVLILVFVVKIIRLLRKPPAVANARRRWKWVRPETVASFAGCSNANDQIVWLMRNPLNVTEAKVALRQHHDILNVAVEKRRRCPPIRRSDLTTTTVKQWQMEVISFAYNPEHIERVNKTLPYSYRNYNHNDKTK